MNIDKQIKIQSKKRRFNDTRREIESKLRQIIIYETLILEDQEEADNAIENIVKLAKDSLELLHQLNPGVVDDSVWFTGI